jgi:hypothetical protein
VTFLLDSDTNRWTGRLSANATSRRQHEGGPPPSRSDQDAAAPDSGGAEPGLCPEWPRARIFRMTAGSCSMAISRRRPPQLGDDLVEHGVLGVAGPVDRSLEGHGPQVGSRRRPGQCGESDTPTRVGRAAARPLQAVRLRSGTVGRAASCAAIAWSDRGRAVVRETLASGRDPDGPPRLQSTSSS